MRLKTKGGVPPCDRRLDRRKVAIAAIAALLFATTAQAAIVDFEVDTSLSTITRTLKISGPINVSTIAQASPTPLDPTINSDTARLYGSIQADVGATKFSIPAGNADIGFVKSGNYIPFDPAPADPNGAGTTFGEYGLVVPTLLWVVFYDEKATFDLGAPLGNNAGNDLTGTPLTLFQGYGAQFNSLTGGDSGSIAGQFSLLGSNGSATATLAGGTLTIPVNSSLGPVDIGSGFFLTTVETGVIVAHAKVPEPSTLLLLGFGVVGLITCAWRVRRRK